MNLAKYIKHLLSLGLKVEFSPVVHQIFTISIESEQMYITIDDYSIDRIEFNYGVPVDTKEVVLMISRAEELIKLLKEEDK